jgi:hypothetical protein
MRSPRALFESVPDQVNELVDAVDDALALPGLIVTSH